MFSAFNNVVLPVVFFNSKDVLLLFFLLIAFKPLESILLFF